MIGRNIPQPREPERKQKQMHHARRRYVHLSFALRLHISLCQSLVFRLSPNRLVFVGGGPAGFMQALGSESRFAFNIEFEMPTDIHDCDIRSCMYLNIGGLA